jgi:hypothetical protein
MMTLFFEVAQAFLKQGIDALVETSKATDDGLLNTVRNKCGEHLFFIHGRNTELSVNKRKQLSELKERILAMDVAGLSDQTIYTQLKGHLSTGVTALTQLCQQAVYPQGATEKGLSGLILLLRQMHEKMQQLAFIDKAHDADPLTCLQYYMAMNSAHILFDEYMASVNLKNPEMIQAKEMVIQMHMGLYLEDIKAFDAKKPGYEAAKIKQVTYHIGLIQQATRAIDQQYLYKFGGPIFTNYRDHLQDYLTQAIAELATVGMDELYSHDVL